MYRVSQQKKLFKDFKERLEKSCFYTSLVAISSFANIDGSVTFLLYDLECKFLF